MRFVAVETGQAMSAPQTPTTTRHYFLEMISLQYSSFYVTARVISMVPILVDVHAFALPSRPPSINPPPPTVSHRVSVLLIISRTPRLIRTIQQLLRPSNNTNRQLRPFDPDFCLEDGCGAFSFRRTLVDDLLQRHLHHFPDEYFASQAAGTSSMDKVIQSHFTNAMRRSISSLAYIVAH
jgi:hypothetical protein